METESGNGNGNRKREMVVTAIRTQYKLSMPGWELKGGPGGGGGGDTT